MLMQAGAERSLKDHQMSVQFSWFQTLICFWGQVTHSHLSVVRECVLHELSHSRTIDYLAIGYVEHFYKICLMYVEYDLNVTRATSVLKLI